MAPSKSLAMPSVLGLVAALCSVGPAQAFYTSMKSYEVSTSVSATSSPCGKLNQCQTCNHMTKKKEPMMAGTPCFDGSHCNGRDECDAKGLCINVGSPVECTTDNTDYRNADMQCVSEPFCAEELEGECTVVFRGGHCDDGYKCTEYDRCDWKDGSCSGQQKPCIHGQVCDDWDGECKGPCGTRTCDDDSGECTWSNCGQCNECVGDQCMPKDDPHCPPCYSCSHDGKDCVYDCNDDQECQNVGGEYMCMDNPCSPGKERHCGKKCLSCANNKCYGDGCEDNYDCKHGQCKPRRCTWQERKDCKESCYSGCEGGYCTGGCHDDETCVFEHNRYRCEEKCPWEKVQHCESLCQVCEDGYCTGGCKSGQECQEDDDGVHHCVDPPTCDYDKVKECADHCQKCKDGYCVGGCEDWIPYSACNTIGYGKAARGQCLACSSPGRACCDGDTCLNGLICDPSSHTCAYAPHPHVW